MAEALNCRCMCGAVTFSAAPERMTMGVCHCSMCRRWSGGAYMAVGCGESVEFADGAPVTTFDSSAWAERLFCAKCGSTLVWQIKGGKHQSVSAQAFEDPSVFEFRSQIFFDEKPSNFDFANETRNMTGAEVMAIYAPKSEGAQ
ncbi:MAG: GFA family protein [Rhizobiaceae bacterium]|nr:GFA family protein [Rhizobiaceae bacterium]